jgi:hypothetical protein
MVLLPTRNHATRMRFWRRGFVRNEEALQLAGIHS